MFYKVPSDRVADRQYYVNPAPEGNLQVLAQQLDSCKTLTTDFKAAGGDFLPFSELLYPTGDWGLKRTLYPFLSNKRLQFMTLRHPDKNRQIFFFFARGIFKWNIKFYVENVD